MGKNSWMKNYFRIGLTFTISVCLCIVFYEVIRSGTNILGYFSKVFSAMAPITIGLVIAYLINPIMVNFRRGIAYLFGTKWKKTDYDTAYKKAKIPALILSMVVFFGLVIGFLILVIPQIYDSLKDLVDKTPGYLNQAKDWAEKMFAKNEVLEEKANQVIDYLQNNVFTILSDKIMPNIDTIAVKVTSGVVLGLKAILNFFLGLIVTVYLLISKETLLAQAKKLIYWLFSRKTGNKILRGASYANSVFGGFIIGKIIDSIIIGILCLVFTSAMGYEYAVLMSVIVGVTNVIPFFGPFIGAVPGSLLALMQDPLMMVIFLIWILILQQFDGNILGPLILGDSTGLSSIWVLVAILVGGDLFGVVGLILGVPVFACIYAFFAVLMRDGLRRKKLSPRTEDYYGLVEIDESTGKARYRDPHAARMTIRKSKKKAKLDEQMRKLHIKKKDGEETEAPKKQTSRIDELDKAIHKLSDEEMKSNMRKEGTIISEDDEFVEVLDVLSRNVKDTKDRYAPDEKQEPTPEKAPETKEE